MSEEQFATIMSRFDVIEQSGEELALALHRTGENVLRLQVDLHELRNEVRLMRNQLRDHRHGA